MWLSTLVRLPALLGVVALSSQLSLCGQGFGWPKKNVVLQRKLPAIARISNGTIAVQPKNINPQYHGLEKEIQATIETELLHTEKTLKLTQDHPTYSVIFGVKNYHAEAPRQESRKDGSVVTVYEVIRGSLDVFYQIRSGQLGEIDADNLPFAMNDERPISTQGGNTWVDALTRPGFIPGRKNKVNQAKTGGDVKSQLVMIASKTIAARLGNTVEELEVPLAKDNKFDTGNKLMTNLRYDDALREYMAVPKFPDDTKDGYRIYNLGVAQEALGYKSTDPRSAKILLEKAQQYYQEAFDSKRGEVEFQRALNRIETAIAHYRKLDSFQMPKQPAPRANQPGVADVVKPKSIEGAPPVTPAPAPSPASAPSKEGGGVTLVEIKQALAGGVSARDVIDIINSAEALDVNPRKLSDLTRLSQAKLPLDVENAIRKKVGMALRTASPKQTTPATKPVGAPAPAAVQAAPAAKPPAPAPAKP